MSVSQSRLVSRRQLLRGLLAFSAGAVAIGGYAVAEPWRLTVTRYAISPPRWPGGLKLRCAIVADIHACDPWMGEARIRQIVARTNALGADIILLLGDYVAGHRLARWSSYVPDHVWAGALAGLSAPLGVHAVLGNHDWWHDLASQDRRRGPISVGLALEAAGIPVYENKAVRLVKEGRPFWLAGLGDQWAFWPVRKRRHPKRGTYDYEGVDDLPATLRQVSDDAPVILLAHEPDVFPEVPDRVAVTVSGHTHGGQVTVAGFAPIVPSRFGRRYVYGHIVEGGRNLLVSGGLGCSGYPLRLGRPPEIVVLDLVPAQEAKGAVT